MKIFLLSPIAHTLLTESQISLLQQAGDLHIITDVKPLGDISELFEGDEPRILAVDPDFCNWAIPDDIIDRMPNLQAVCLQTTSFSWIDVDHARQKGVTVTNLRGFSSTAVAEWATMVTLALARKLPVVMKDGWKIDFKNHQGIELRGKTAGIIGLGRIGTKIAENMAGLGMNVQYWSKNSRDERFNNVSLDELFKTSDVILPAFANSQETSELITESMVASIKPSAIVMSIVHPVHHETLLNRAAAGQLYGYGFEEEGDTPFGQHSGNVWNGPALAWCTDQSMSNNADQWVTSIIDASKSSFPTAVNG